MSFFTFFELFKSTTFLYDFFVFWSFGLLPCIFQKCFIFFKNTILFIYLKIFIFNRQNKAKNILIRFPISSIFSLPRLPIVCSPTPLFNAFIHACGCEWYHPTPLRRGQTNHRSLQEHSVRPRKRTPWLPTSFPFLSDFLHKTNLHHLRRSPLH